MRLRPHISLSLLLLTLPAAFSQTADDFFNGGAQSYISNNIPNALEVVTNGLQRFPENEKLKKLYELLNQKQQQQNQQKQEQQKQQQNQQKQQQQQQQKQQEQQQKNQSSQQQEQQKQEQQAKSSAAHQKEKSGENEQNKSMNPVTAHEMTPQEAKQLLDAQKGEEQVLQLKPEKKPENSQRPIKDW